MNNSQNKIQDVDINKLCCEKQNLSDNIENLGKIRCFASVLNETLKSDSIIPTKNLLLEQNLNEYRQLTFLEAEKLKNTYHDIWKELSAEHVQVNNWKSNLKDASYYANKYSCQGNYEDCKKMEITQNDLDNIFISKSQKTISSSQESEPEIKSLSQPSTSTYYNQQEQIIQNRKFQLKVYNPSNKPVTANPSTSQFQSNSPKAKPNYPTINNNQNPVPPIQSTNNFKIDFRTGLQELNIQNLQKRKAPTTSTNDPTLCGYGGTTKKYLGNRRVCTKFVSPILQVEQQSKSTASVDLEEDIDERLKNIDPKMIELIRSEIMDSSTPVQWNDIAGLRYAKTIIQEAIILPILRPDIFTGLRRPPRGILLFGPPGTGKTLLGKCIASQTKSTFFSISASSLTSKWIGDGEKMVRALFAVATVHQPSVVFIDEIDSILCQRSETEHESSRRLKTEFLIQLDGVGGDEDRILIVGATNRPQELDEAARRRLTKRLYIPLPDSEAREQILRNLIANERHQLDLDDLKKIVEMSEGYSGADIKTLCHEASMGPIRSISFDQLQCIDRNDVRPLIIDDFRDALSRVRASVAPSDLVQYVKWDNTYGSGGATI